MKKAKLLSLFLAGTLLFQTAGIDALATQGADPVVIGTSAGEAQTAEDPTAPAEGSEDKDPAAPAKDSEDKDPAAPAEGSEDKDPTAPAEGSEDKDPAAPAEGSEDKDPAGSTEDPAAPTEGSEDKDPAESTEDPAAPTEGSEDKDPAESTEDPAAPTEGSEDKEPAESTEDPDAPAEEETLPAEDSVSENTVSENTLPEEEAEEAEDLWAIFPGLGDSYHMSSQQLADKRTLYAHMGDVVSAGSRYTDYYPDAEGLYELGKVLYSAGSEAEAQQIAAAFGGTLDSYAYHVAEIKLPQKATVAMAVAAAADPDTKLPAVWPNYYDYLYTDTAPISSLPKDEKYATQWQHDYIGTSYAYAMGYRGEGVKVAVIDTGLEKNHEDLKANALDGKSFVGQSASTLNTDNQTHGTHVAGIIAADDNETGGMGIAPDAQVAGFAVFSTDESKGAETADIIRALNAAVTGGYDIVNMSLGGPMYNDIYAKAVQEAYNSGVAVFAAAGNENTNAFAFPASYTGAISIGAVDQNGARASFSNYGSAVKLSFPGMGIYSTLPTGYGYMNGTSQASPAAAGTAAVILSAKRDSDFKGLSGKAKVDKLLSLMKSSTTKSTSSGMGAGTTWLPGVLQIATDATVPETPEITVVSPFTQDKKGNYISEGVSVTLSTKTIGSTEIYYTTDGKTPSFKNGIRTDNTIPYSDIAFMVGDAKKVTIKAIARNPITGKVSKVASKTFNFAPNASGVEVTSAGNVTRIAAGKSLKLTATVTPSYAASTKVSWTVDDTAKAASITVANGTVKTKATTPAGTYKITATAQGADGKPLSPTVTAEFPLTVIAKADVKKVAFVQNGKTYKAPALSVGAENLDLKQYLQVTKQDNSVKTGEAAIEDVVWSTSNAKAATVADGVVTAVAGGKATIKATANDGSGKSASLTVTVNQPVVSIRIPDAASVASGKSIALSAALNTGSKKPTKAKLNWTVTGNDNVTVTAAGKVSAKKGASGICTVTAAAADGSGIVSNACTITIVSGAITNIALSDKTLTLFSPQAAEKIGTKAPTEKQLTATVTGATGFDKNLVAWTSSAPGIASVDGGVVKAVSAGKATITCAATDGSGKKATCTVNVTIPMSKLAISVSDSWGIYDADSKKYVGYIAAGKSIKMSARYSSNYGAPTNKAVTWTSDNPSITVDKNGKVTASKSAVVGSSAVITATAADGSGVTSNAYTLKVTPLFKRVTIEDGCLAVGWVDAENGYILSDYYTVSVSGGKNPGLSRNYVQVGKEYYECFLPIPGKVTVPANISSSTTRLLSKYTQSMTLSVKLQDGSNLKANRKLYAARFADGVVKYFK